MKPRRVRLYFEGLFLEENFLNIRKIYGIICVFLGSFDEDTCLLDAEELLFVCATSEKNYEKKLSKAIKAMKADLDPEKTLSFAYTRLEKFFDERVLETLKHQFNPKYSPPTYSEYKYPKTTLTMKGDIEFFDKNVTVE